jgi:DNA gyrase inhibitor GyrI
MMNEELTVTRKQVEDLPVASIRFRGRHEEIATYFQKLRAEVEPYMTGEGLCLYHRSEDENPAEARELEVCYPVSEPIVTREIGSRILPGGEMLSFTHSSRASKEEASWGPGDWWRVASAYLWEHEIEIETEPLREIHRRVGDGLVKELQLALLQPKWLDRMSQGLERLAGEGIRQEVMAGSEDLVADSPMEERLAWLRGAMERLDVAVDDPVIRGTVLTGCAHRFPAGRIEKMRAEYRRLGGLDELLALMHADRSLGDLSWYETMVWEGPVLHVTKDPVDPKGYRQATSETEKRAHYCHCPAGRAAIRTHQTMSPTFCHCGAGWYVQLWEGILGEPVRVEVTESVLQGDDRCSFAIHLPPGVLAKRV